MDDVSELTQLVLRERQGRDRARWQRMRDAWEPDGRVTISWIDGTATDFIRGSIAMAASGLAATHRMSPPVVDIEGDRAVVEAPAVIEVRALLAGTEVDLASRVRLLYRARRHDVGWLLHSLICVYESDAVVPTTPGIPAVPLRPTEGSRPPYRWLTTALRSAGHAIADDLPGADLPDTVVTIDQQHAEWVRQGEPA